ncbi:uncharacterized protein LOC136076672 isoform X1 [Hydra vulgaris]|uniref:Uncharacterized protein LOC136076672 isoform X1 n=2 Tax=Hydra vulgaris TaxID=6087 RepID=A0ABM4BAZ8_HYDVU
MFKLGESFVKLTRHYITSTDESMAFSCSDSFASFAVLKEAIRKYEDTSFIKLWVRDARTIEAARKSIPKKAALMAADIKYYFIKYCCIHGGQKLKYCGKGKRKTSTFKKDCPFYLNFKASEDGQFLVLHTMNNTHNHEVSEILYKHLPNQRKLPDYAIEKAKELMHLKPNKKLLQKELIKSTGKIITLRDLLNIAASSNKVENRNDITTFVTTLKDKYNANVEVLLDSDNNLKGIFFKTILCTVRTIHIQSSFVLMQHINCYKFVCLFILYFVKIVVVSVFLYTLMIWLTHP